MASICDDDDQTKNVSGYFTKIDRYTNDTGFEDYLLGSKKEITKFHWKTCSSVSKCANPACRRPLNGVFDRYLNCRKCGDLFCSGCLQYKRRLNRLAHFDPDGQSYKVCKVCFEKDVITDGQSKNVTADFLKLRSFLKSRAVASGAVTIDSIWKGQASFSKECQRLLDGFASFVARSDILQTFQQMKSVLSTPEWMKSSICVRENLQTQCRLCEESFGLRKTKSFCRVCGAAVCRTCSSQDLLLYVPDNNGNDNKHVRMAIIRIIGCPEVEPEISIHVRVCPKCKELLISQQAEEADEDQSLLTSSDFMELIKKLHQKFQEAEAGVRIQLPKYMKVVESLEDSSKQTSERSNTKILAKAQQDVADALARHVSLVQQLKKLKPSTAKQDLLYKSFTRAKCEFYLDNMSSFRLVRNKLSESMPPESLDFIQGMMDKNAIISTHLATRQLLYELLYFSQGSCVDEELPSFLVSVEQEIEAEVKKSLTQSREDVGQHLEVVKEMIRIAIKDHKLIRMSKTDLKRKGKILASQLVLARTEDILNQILNQLRLASANRSFQASKKSVEEAVVEIKTWRTSLNLNGDLDGFVVVANSNSKRF